MLEIGKQKVQNSGEILQTLREQAKASRMNFEADKQTVAAGHQNLGSMTKGMQIRAQQLEAKRKRIAGGSKEEFTHHELGIMAGLHGTKLQDTARIQSEKAGKALGIEMSPDLKASREKAQRDQERLDKNEAPLLADMKQGTEKNVAGSAKLVDQMKEAFKADDIAAGLVAIGREWQATMKDAISQMKSYIK